MPTNWETLVQAKDIELAELQQQLRKYDDLHAQLKQGDTDAAETRRVSPPTPPPPPLTCPSWPCCGYVLLICGCAAQCLYACQR